MGIGKKRVDEKKKKIERKIKSGLSGIRVRRFIKIKIIIVLEHNKLSQNFSQ